MIDLTPCSGVMTDYTLTPAATRRQIKELQNKAAAEGFLKKVRAHRAAKALKAAKAQNKGKRGKKIKLDIPEVRLEDIIGPHVDIFALDREFSS